MKYLVAGAAGFIGGATFEKINAAGHDVVSIDNANDYYDVNLKHARLVRIRHPKFKFINLEISGREALSQLFHKKNSIVSYTLLHK
ncbi:TPA: NAD-dependent epimerase/dehydratase family protein [Enterobacter hormaechei]|nr:NAD-dependent epimerase/dehydratase family protein [Enterobacter hormaechei]